MREISGAGHRLFSMVSVLWLLVGFLATVAAFAEEASAAQRPRVGLVLSGGGARGLAHIGVLEVLEELRVPIDVVTGTSMGAVVGGFYASGLPVAEIEQVLAGLDWGETLIDRTTYRDLPFRRKEDDRRYQIGITLGLKGGKVALASGLLSGQKLAFLLRSYALPVREIEDFRHLPIPFAAVAADLETGEPVVLDRGDLALSIRASTSIPGVFAPVEVDDRLLVDGGIANNLPVDVARQLGAEVVIAVDISEPLLKRDALGSVFSVAGQTLSMLMRRNMGAQLDDADLVVVPPVSDFGAVSYGEAVAIIEAGRQLDDATREALRALALDEAGWQALRRRQTPPPASRALPVVDFIRFEGGVRTDERLIRRRLRTEIGQPLDLAVLEDDMARLYGLGDFQQVAYDLVREDDATGLVVTLIEKPWGPTFLRFGLELTSDLEGETGLAAVVNATRTRLNSRGLEWRTDLSVGNVQGVRTELYQPLGFSSTLFVAPRISWQQELQDVFDQGEQIAEYDVETAEWGLDLGIQLGRNGELRFGVLGGRVDASRETGAIDLPDVSVDVGGVRGRFTLDSRDNPRIARRGSLLETELFLSRPGVGADDSYDRLALSFDQFFSFGRHTIGLGLSGGTDLGSTIPFYDEFLVGGLFSLSGYEEGQLRGGRFGLARLAYYTQVASLPTGLGTGLYLGGVLEAGQVFQTGEDVSFDDLRSSATVFAAADTFLGVLAIAYSQPDEGRGRLSLNIGRTF